MKTLELQRQFFPAINNWLKDQELDYNDDYNLDSKDKKKIYPIHGLPRDQQDHPAYIVRPKKMFDYFGYRFDIRFIFTRIPGNRYGDQYNVYLIVEETTDSNKFISSITVTGINDSIDEPKRHHGMIDYSGNEVFEHYPTIREITIDLLRKASNDEERASTLFNMIEADRY